MSFNTALLAICLTVVTLGAGAYLIEAIRDWHLGRAFRRHMGSRHSAWHVIKAHRAAEDAETDALIRRGMREAAKHPSWMWHRRKKPALRVQDPPQADQRDSIQAFRRIQSERTR